MDRKLVVEKFLLLYVPWALSLLFKEQAVTSYLIAWFGSFFIFFMTLTGQIVPLPDDRSFAEQMMRPIILVQIIFAGYMCCTSIFYFLSLLGYYNFTATPYYLPDPDKLNITAQCQRYYILGHAAMVSGILFFMRYQKPPKYKQTRTGWLSYFTTLRFSLFR